MKKIIVVVGMAGSGKSFAADIFAEKLHTKVFRTGDVIREEIKKRGLEYNPGNDAKIAHWFHTQGREKLIIKRTWDKIKKYNRDIVVVEGCRAAEELFFLRKYSKINLIIIAIKADFDTRLERTLERKRFGKAEGRAYMKSRNRLEIHHGIGKVIREADYSIDNSELSKKQMKKRIAELAKGLKWMSK